MRIKSRLLPLGALALGLALAVVLAYGGTGSNPDTAQAHTGTGEAHVEIDTNLTNGSGPCDIIDPALTVFAGANFQVAICLSDSDQAPLAGLANTIDIKMHYDPEVTAPDVIDDNSLDLNANPDFDEVSTDQGADGDWDCNLSNNVASAPSGTPSPADLVCATGDNLDNMLDTPVTILAIVSMTALTPTPGADLFFDSTTNFLSGVNNPLCDVDIDCFDATVEVLDAGDLTLDKTCTPNPVDAGGQVSCTLSVFNNGPGNVPNVLVLDNLPDDKIYRDDLGDGNDAGTDYCGPVDPMLIGGMLNVVACGSIGIGGNQFVSLAANTGIDFEVVYDVPLSAAGKPETDAALVIGTAVLGIPIVPFPDPDLDPVVLAVASVPPCSMAPDPVFCAGLALITVPGPVFCGAGSILGPLGTACDNADRFTVDVNSADVTITKTVAEAVGQVGGQLNYTITVDVLPGSPASTVIIEDTVDANQSIVSATMSVPVAACVVSGVPGVTPNNDATCTVTNPILPGDPAVTVQVVANVLDDVGNNCNNLGEVTFADPITLSDETDVLCLPPDVRMVKSADLEDPNNIVDTVNLWLCHNPDVDGDGFQDGIDPPEAANPACEAYDEPNGEIDNNGGGHLVIFERVFNALDPHGVGAFEFQLKFDHKIFDIEIFHGVDLNADGDCEDNGEDQAIDTVDACFLYQTGRIPFADNDPNNPGGCNMTIVTENFILFGCVSKEDPNAVIPADGTPEDAADCGNGLDDDADNVPDDGCPIELGPVVAQDVVATIHIDPEDDLKFRLTPGQKNGVLRTILDENCELADIYGDPLADQFGNPLPGIVTGGLVEVCADLHVTTRILEGDLDLDCDVDVTDDQMIAFRYGGFFGNLLYDPWFDLEPSLKDFDIDIKDLQKVFGRNGSTCDDPIPDNQQPEEGGGFNGNPAPNPGP